MVSNVKTIHERLEIKILEEEDEEAREMNTNRDERYVILRRRGDLSDAGTRYNYTMKIITNNYSRQPRSSFLGMAMPTFLKDMDLIGTIQDSKSQGWILGSVAGATFGFFARRFF